MVTDNKNKIVNQNCESVLRLVLPVLGTVTRMSHKTWASCTEMCDSCTEHRFALQIKPLKPLSIASTLLLLLETFTKLFLFTLSSNNDHFTEHL